MSASDSVPVSSNVQKLESQIEKGNSPSDADHSVNATKRHICCIGTGGTTDGATDGATGSTTGEDKASKDEASDNEPDNEEIDDDDEDDDDDDESDCDSDSDDDDEDFFIKRVSSIEKTLYVFGLPVCKWSMRRK